MRLIQPQISWYDLVFQTFGRRREVRKRDSKPFKLQRNGGELLKTTTGAFSGAFSIRWRVRSATLSISSRALARTRSTRLVLGKTAAGVGAEETVAAGRLFRLFNLFLLRAHPATPACLPTALLQSGNPVRTTAVFPGVPAVPARTAARSTTAPQSRCRTPPLDTPARPRSPVRTATGLGEAHRATRCRRRKIVRTTGVSHGAPAVPARTAALSTAVSR